jgi:hypothetical protein
MASVSVEIHTTALDVSISLHENSPMRYVVVRFAEQVNWMPIGYEKQNVNELLGVALKLVEGAALLAPEDPRVRTMAVALRLEGVTDDKTT